MKRNLIVVFLILMAAVSLMAKDRVEVQVYESSANIWYFHTPEKGLNFYFMKCWPNGLLLTKFGPPAFKIGKKVAVSIAIGPHLDVDAGSFKDLLGSVTMDVIPTFFSGKLGVVLVNEVGVNKDGKGTYYMKHTVSYNRVGMRWSTNVAFGEKANFFRIGPIMRFGKLQLWFADDVLSGKWMVEAGFSIKL